MKLASISPTCNHPGTGAERSPLSLVLLDFCLVVASYSVCILVGLEGFCSPSGTGQNVKNSIAMYIYKECYTTEAVFRAGGRKGRGCICSISTSGSRPSEQRDGASSSQSTHLGHKGAFEQLPLGHLGTSQGHTKLKKHNTQGVSKKCIRTSTADGSRYKSVGF